MVLQTNTNIGSEQLVCRFSERVNLEDGLRTTIHIVRYNRNLTRTHLVSFVHAVRLLDWCKEYGFAEAMGGGYFIRKSAKPLGEALINGKKLPSLAFPAPWHKSRGSVYMPVNRALQIAPRDKLPATPRGDLLQAGPTLVHQGASTFSLEPDPEGFSATAFQHDEDINAKRHPRAAIGCNDDFIWTVTADGRAREDAGLLLPEMAEIMLQLGATDAVNLDGGSSSSQISDYKLMNQPRTNDQESSNGFPIHNAIVFTTTAK
jgi:hypothetical protein